MPPEEPTVTIELDVNGNRPVGPVPNVYGHGPVTAIGSDVFFCMDCGYVTEDTRLLAHVECDRQHNGIALTWREWFEDEDADELPTHDDHPYPIDG